MKKTRADTERTDAVQPNIHYSLLSAQYCSRISLKSALTVHHHHYHFPSQNPPNSHRIPRRGGETLVLTSLTHHLTPSRTVPCIPHASSPKNPTQQNNPFYPGGRSDIPMAGNPGYVRDTLACSVGSVKTAVFTCARASSIRVLHAEKKPISHRPIRLISV